MIKIEDLYNATNHGLDIILEYYPAARDCVGQKNKHFKRRSDEDDASACIKLFESKDGPVYKVTDFGDTATAQSPIDICMHEEGLRFNEAILKLAARYGIKDELNRNINKPEIRKRPATTEEKDGTRFFELEETIPPHHLRILGPKVTIEHAEALHWHLAKCVSYVKNREVISKFSTDNYPIFMRECVVDVSADGKETKFYKIYEPLNPDKQYRFSYTPDGVKPKQYINGLFELRKVFQDYNKAEEAKFNSLPENEGKPYKEKKLNEAFLCSGERDSLCVRSLGYYPLWFNSETYKVSNEEIREICKYVEVLYNIPDIDATGVKKGTELALRFIDIHTIWLPQWLRGFRDNRGKSRKDFRDFMELRTKIEDFRNLIQLAMPARFWDIQSSEKKRRQHEIDSSCLHYFLRLNGFRTLHDENLDSVRYVRISGNIVSSIKAKDIRRFLFQFAEERALPRDIRNLLLNSPRLSDSALEHLQEVSLDFTGYTPHSQMFFFTDKCIEVTGKEIVEKPGDNTYVWEESVIPHKIKILPDMFHITHNVNAEGYDLFDIDVVDTSSKLFGYVINTSRVHWRKELEYSLEDKSTEEFEKYRNEHKFDIAGPNLSAEEIEEQKKNLIAKLFTIGYTLHRYKSPSQAWAPYAMDNKIGDENECNGRSGKSFLFRALSYFMKTVKLSGRNPKLMDNPHVFDQVTEHTDLVIVDDCDKYLQTGVFYDNITSDMTVNPKNNHSYTIPFDVSPKFAFTTNYVPKEFDPSSEGRLLYMVFSDYYHQKTEDNDYLETRQIRDDFNKNLLTGYSEEEWELDINFLMQCLRFYLEIAGKNIKIQPPMANIIKRKYKSDMGGNFEDWACSYFAKDGDNVNHFIVREKAREDFQRFSNLNKVTMQYFTKALKAFVELSPYISELNPVQFQNGQGRIIRKNDEGKSTEYLYLRTVDAPLTIEEQKDGDELPFVPPAAP